MHEESEATTNSTGTGAGCEIGNMDPSCLDEMGIPLTTANEYGFSYQLATWPSNITTKDKDENDQEITVNIPIYGYVMSDLKAGAAPVKDLKARFDIDTDGNSIIKLDWTDPSKDINPVGSFVLYQVYKDGELEYIDEIDKYLKYI